ncbi:MAG: hypothetical protein R2745_23995 [Vicinamibacterales bacterium]
MPRMLGALAVLGAAALAAAGVPVRAQERAPAGDFAGRVVLSRDRTIGEALERIARGSRSWRDALARLEASDRRIVVLTPDEVVVRDAGTAGPATFDPGALAEVSPVADESGRVAVVLVVVNVRGMREAHERRGSLPGELDADLERVLAHEVYGHAVPYLEAGHLSGRCADPVAGAPATSACAVQRENVIRAELRLGRRTDHALGSLALSRFSPR